MLSDRRAGALARRAGRWRRDGSRGILARRAWRRLIAAGDRGDPNATDAVWQAWLRDPGDEVWQALARWREPQALAEAAVTAASEPGRPASGRAAIGKFCGRRGIVPGDPVRRALFYLLTGQPDQHRAADPDGSLLAAAYQAAADPARAALRGALAETGDLDLVHRVVSVASRSEQATSLADTERQYLTDQLASRGDWERLWRLARDLPLAGAVSAVSRIGGGWRPADEAQVHLFALLARTRAEAVADAAAGVVAHIPAGRWLVSDISFAADRSALAMATVAPAVRGWADLHKLPGGRRVWRHSTYTLHRVIRLAGAVVCLEGNPWVRAGLYRLVRYRHEGHETLWSGNQIPWLAPFPGGFLLAQPGSTTLWFGAAEGRLVRHAEVSGLHQDWADDQLSSLGSEPVTGRLAIALRHGTGSVLAVLEADLQVIGHIVIDNYFSYSGGYPHENWLVFCGPDRLVTLGGDRALRSWKVAPGLPEEARAACSPCRGVTALPRTGQVVLNHRKAQPTWLDARTLGAAPCPPGLRSARRVWASGDGEYAAGQRDDGDLTVHDLRFDEIARLLALPMADVSPVDLRAVAAAQAVDPHSEAGQVIGVLAECLRYRFGADVAVNQSVAATPEAPGLDDIGLSARAGPAC